MRPDTHRNEAGGPAKQTVIPLWNYTAPTTEEQRIAEEMSELVRAGAIVYLSHSGGKDSQATYNYVASLVPDDQIKLIYADLGKMEWAGTKEHIKAVTRHPLNIVQAKKTLFDMVRHRASNRPEVPSWPSHRYRQCTSDLKVQPIYKFIRQDMKTHGATLAINTVGLRAEESKGRAQKTQWQPNKTLSKAGRAVYDWFPIFRWTEPEVFEYIAKWGQQPFWIYQVGNRRKSCVFCILGCTDDLANGRLYRPELYQEYIDLEHETGWTMFPDGSLQQRLEGANDTKRTTPNCRKDTRTA